MLGIFIIAFIAKAYADLAGEYNRNKWIYGGLGVVSYYGGTFVGGFLIGLYILYFTNINIDDVNNIGFQLGSIPFGFAICGGIYFFLKSSWKKAPDLNEDLLDENFNAPSK